MIIGKHFMVPCVDWMFAVSTAQVPCQLNQVATSRAMCLSLATEPLVAAEGMI